MTAVDLAPAEAFARYRGAYEAWLATRCPVCRPEGATGSECTGCVTTPMTSPDAERERAT